MSHWRTPPRTILPGEEYLWHETDDASRRIDTEHRYIGRWLSEHPGWYIHESTDWGIQLDTDGYVILVRTWRVRPTVPQTLGAVGEGAVKP